MKVCPVCESALFDDMDTCFGCLYRFGSDPALESARASAAVLWPQAQGGGDDGGWDVGDGRDSGSGGGEDANPATQELTVPGWRLRVRAEGTMAQGSALTIEIEPALG